MHDYTKGEEAVNHLYQQYTMLKNAVREMGGYEADEEICPNAGIHSGNFLTLRASSRSGSIWHLAPPLYLKSGVCRSTIF